jgi:sugar phosphate permease
MSQSPAADAGERDVLPRPTWVRWHIVGLLMAYSFMTWFNRVSMSVAGNARIMQEYDISPTEMGLVYSAFLFAYAVFMTPGGWFIDRFGAKVALVAMGFGSALFGAMTGMAALPIFAGLVLSTLLIVRSLMGLFTAPVYPASSRTIAHWLPLPQRAGANGLVQGAAPAGIACTYTVFGALINGYGWPVAFVITAAVTGLLALAWTLYATDWPAQHPAVNQAELHLIEGPTPYPAKPKARASGAGGDWHLVWRNRSLVLLTISYAAVGYFEYLFFFWMEYYFKDVLQLDETQSRLYAGIPPLAMAVGMVLGGWLSDRLQRSYGYRLGRALVPAGGMIASAGLLYLGVRAQDPRWIVTWFALALGAVGASEGPFWATAIELGGRRGGTAAGLCNTGGNAGGILAPVLTPLLSTVFGWPAAISVGSAVCLLGAGLWWWIDPGERVKEEEPAS